MPNCSQTRPSIVATKGTVGAQQNAARYGQGKCGIGSRKKRLANLRKCAGMRFQRIVDGGRYSNSMHLPIGAGMSLFLTQRLGNITALAHSLHGISMHINGRCTSPVASLVRFEPEAHTGTCLRSRVLVDAHRTDRATTGSCSFEARRLYLERRRSGAYLRSRS